MKIHNAEKKNWFYNLHFKYHFLGSYLQKERRGRDSSGREREKKAIDKPIFKSHIYKTSDNQVMVGR